MKKVDESESQVSADCFTTYFHIFSHNLYEVLESDPRDAVD